MDASTTMPERQTESVLDAVHPDPRALQSSAADHDSQGCQGDRKHVLEMRIRDEVWRWGERTLVMAILNVTPDSFSGDGLQFDQGRLMPRDGRGTLDRRMESSLVAAVAVAAADDAVAAGAAIIDVGGESTRPGAESVSAEVEIARVVPVIEAIRARHSLPISIDTSKATVAEAALRAGADIVNDVWGLRADPDLAGVLARWGAPLVIMHNRAMPENVTTTLRLGGRYVGVHYDDVVADVAAGLSESLAIARDAGIADNRVIIDPGLGFGKTRAQNLELIDRLGELRSHGMPVLVGPSRKSFIGYTLDLPMDERVEGTAATVAVAITRGADIVRVHDVRAMVRVARMTDAIVRRGP